MTHSGILASAALAAALSLATLCPARASGAPSAGTLTFRVVVAGAARDGGVITAPIGAVSDMTGDSDFNGCAIIKQKASAQVLGAQTLEIHVNYAGGTNLMATGVQPYVAQEVYLRIAQYRPTVASYPHGDSAPVDLSFVINRRAYGVALHAIARVRNGGRDGTISGSEALRLYPAVRSHPLHGVSYQASWHCASVLQLSSQF